MLHPNGAAPGTRPPRYELPRRGLKRKDVIGIEVALGNGLFALLRDDGVRITKRGRAGTAVPDPTSLFGMGRLVANDRLVADVIRSHGVSVSRGVDRAALTGRVGDLIDPRQPPARAAGHLQPQGQPRRDRDRGAVPAADLPHEPGSLGARAAAGGGG